MSTQKKKSATVQPSATAQAASSACALEVRIQRADEALLEFLEYGTRLLAEKKRGE